MLFQLAIPLKNESNATFVGRRQEKIGFGLCTAQELAEHRGGSGGKLLTVLETHWRVTEHRNTATPDDFSPPPGRNTASPRRFEPPTPSPDEFRSSPNALAIQIVGGGNSSGERRISPRGGIFRRGEGLGSSGEGLQSSGEGLKFVGGRFPRPNQRESELANFSGGTVLWTLEHSDRAPEPRPKKTVFFQK